MKKILILAVATVSFASVSCKKERTCECTSTSTTVNTPSVGPVTTTSNADSYKNTTEKQSKKYFRMDQQCYSTSQTQTTTGNNVVRVETTETTCTIK
jgi:hypothetical protein